MLVVTLLAAPAAHADELQPTSNRNEPWVSVSATFGIATPLGEAGLELDAHLTDWLSVSAGVGLGASGPQLAAMPRLSMPINKAARVYFGVGASEGRYTWNELTFDEPAKKSWDRAYWLNGELGFERRMADGTSAWTTRVFAGVGKVLNDQDFTCNDEHCMVDHQGDGASQKYVGMSIGYAFANRP